MMMIIGSTNQPAFYGKIIEVKPENHKRSVITNAKEDTMSSLSKGMIFLIFICLTATTSCTPYQAQGGTMGGAMGGIAGAVLDSRNPWRGGVIGAALGALAGATIADVSVQGSRQAAIAERPVMYTTQEGRGTYYAEPLGDSGRTNCKKVREKVYENNRLVSDRIKEVCTGERYSPTY